ncbi:MAG: 3-phosphoshikimate 1-carboxyvinyltransferase [Selenomonadaceae bacterium]|nr:3-phosphoshikimate 1-carboxyvinyltransferase [Selenomonadaceae bacterium]
MTGKREINRLLHGLRGEIPIPGDKSISHRSVMFSALGDTPVHITNFLHAQDCLSTVKCMEALGAKVEFLGDAELVVTGHGLHGLKEPATILDAGNSGTTLRLMMGILAPQPFLATFTGDASLHKRPMARVIQPLSMMGARIAGRDGNRLLPITVLPPEGQLSGMVYDMPVASAQVKSAVLLAGMYAKGDTTVVEPFTSRDHTERMLEAFGVVTEKQGTAVTIHPVEAFAAPREIEVPGDISSAAYWIVAASIIPGSDVLLKHVGVNPTRTGILDVLRDMGANIELLDRRISGGEPAADIHVCSAKLHGTSFGAEIMPRLIDEIPILAVAAAFAEGTTVISGAGELRVKETDRLQAVTDEFNKLSPGLVEASEDGMVIHGGRPVRKAEAASYDDHRMAMSLAIFGAAGEGVVLERPDCVRISYPEFYDILGRNE